MMAEANINDAAFNSRYTPVLKDAVGLRFSAVRRRGMAHPSISFREGADWRLTGRVEEAEPIEDMAASDNDRNRRRLHP